MAAVMATIRGSASAWISRARVKAWVYVVTGRSGARSAPPTDSEAFCSTAGAAGPPPGAPGATVSGARTLTSWRRWTSSSSAGA